MVAHSDIGFARWETALERDELDLIDLRYGGGLWFTERPQEGLAFGLPARPWGVAGLEATFFSYPKRALYRIAVREVSAFRVLDEHGLADLWSARRALDLHGASTFRVRNHAWHKESLLSFVMCDADYSYMIATAWDCLEIVSGAAPQVTFDRELPPDAKLGRRMNHAPPFMNE